MENKYRDQEIQITLWLPEGSVVIADENTYSFHHNDSRYKDILHNGTEGQMLLVHKNKLECLDCPEKETSENDTTWVYDDETNNWKEEVNKDFNDDRAYRCHE